MPLRKRSAGGNAEALQKPVVFELAVFDSFFAKVWEEMKRNALMEKKNVLS